MEEHPNRMVAELVEITALKTKHLCAILELTRKQAQALDKDMTESLYSHIEDKQKHINAIKELDNKFECIYNSLEEKPLNIPVALQTHIIGVRKLTEEIQAIERENYAKAGKTLEEVRQRLKDIDKGKRGYNAYKQASLGKDAIFLDKTK